jgi:hypothetical protein
MTDEKPKKPRKKCINASKIGGSEKSLNGVRKIGGSRSGYTIEMAKEICNAIATSNYGISRLCKQNSHWPDYTTIFKWLFDTPEFQVMYLAAKKAQVEIFVDEIIDISNDSSQDTLFDKDGNPYLNKEFVMRSRVKIDTRKWIASRLNRSRYAEHVEKSLSEKVNEIQTELDLSKATPEELEIIENARAIADRLRVNKSGESAA